MDTQRDSIRPLITALLLGLLLNASFLAADSGYRHADEPIGTVREVYDGHLYPDVQVNTFRNIDRLFATRTVQRGATVQTLPTATLRDYARFGLFLLNDGVIDGRRVLPKGWMKQAASRHVIGGQEVEYGYMLWPLHGRSFAATGSTHSAKIAARAPTGSNNHHEPCDIRRGAGVVERA